MHLSWQLNCWSLRRSWSIACRPCSNYIFILDLIHGFNRLGKDNFKTERESLKFWDLVWLILEILRYVLWYKIQNLVPDFLDGTTIITISDFIFMENTAYQYLLKDSNIKSSMYTCVYIYICLVHAMICITSTKNNVRHTLTTRKKYIRE